MKATTLFYLSIGFTGLLTGLQANAFASGIPSSPGGEAIVVAHVGDARTRYPAGPVHEGRFESRSLFKGAAMGEASRIITGRNGHLCMVLSPGALMHVPPNTELTLSRLRHSAQGLPRREEDLVRQIALRLDRGGVYIDGGVPTPSMDIRIETDAGTVQAQGGIFSVTRLDDGNWSLTCETYTIEWVDVAGERHELAAGEYAVVSADRFLVDPGQQHTARHNFRLCRGFFRDLEGFRHPIRGFDRQGVAQYIGLDGAPVFLGYHGLVADVSPSQRPSVAGRVDPVLPPRVAGPGGRRWGEERIWAWWRDVGVIRGVNYIPRNCVNSTEFWMAETFDANLIDEELGWARQLGYTAVRIPLQQAVWRHDPDGFLDRMESFLKLAADHGLAVVPVLFDDLNRAGHDPTFGPQPDPVPDVHNAQWVPSPGPSHVVDAQHWPQLEDYTRAVVRKFRRDRRILYWDLYNTVGNDDLWEQSLPLMEKVFDWVRDIDPRQPLAVPAWKKFGSPMTARILERSDVLTFHSFENADMLEAKIELLQRYNRPLVLSDWLMRQQESTFESILPVCATYGVGWFNRGLVQGRAQMWIQDAAFRSEDAPDVWQHDVLKPDGTPYDDNEVEWIRAFRYREGTGQ